MGLFKKSKKDDSDKVEIKVNKKEETASTKTPTDKDEKKQDKSVDVEKKTDSIEVELKSDKKQDKKKTTKKEKKSEKTEKIDNKKDTKEAYKYLIRPLISEKVAMQGALNQYGFEISKRANKVEIKKAIKALYGVDVEKVNIVNVRGKKTRYGRKEGSRKNWKKAIVFVKEGQKIELYEGV
jgi:large subunit ribosomal protein L23